MSNVICMLTKVSTVNLKVNCKWSPIVCIYQHLLGLTSDIQIPSLTLVGHLDTYWELFKISKYHFWQLSNIWTVFRNSLEILTPNLTLISHLNKDPKWYRYNCHNTCWICRHLSSNLSYIWCMYVCKYVCIHAWMHVCTQVYVQMHAYCQETCLGTSNTKTVIGNHRLCWCMYV